ncbi:cation diffusion facilitator family transporter [Membranihabitans maritimus]|uniref:cation diffusion facilitator family transporter n=1 Tax=Membranihabitans maritimus TaxID=2904244 RepID=UPI001F474CF6|nr:cation diffusion facilitator family transporter [Membranihabitans maritimus]
MDYPKKAIQSAFTSIVVNVGLATIKIITGILGSSFALIADGIESISDIFSSLLVLFGIKYAVKPPDKNHPYGHGRAEPLITFVIVGLLVLSSIFIIYQSILHIQQPHSTPRPYTLIILTLIIIVKEIMYRRMNRRGKEFKSTTLQADAWHHRSDAITSFTAFIGIAVAIIMGPGYEAADDWAAIVAAVIILLNAYLIFRPALGEIMDENLHQEMIQKIRDIAASEHGILETEKCFIRKTGMYYHVDLHAVVDGDKSVKEGHLLAHNLKDSIQREIPEIIEILIHIEPDHY